MVYIDDEFKCHTSNLDGKYRKIEKQLFTGMCDTWIEGMIYVPENEVCILDGVEYHGETHFPWKPYDELDAAQRLYEKQLLAEYESALAESVRLSDLDAAYQEGVNAAYDR